MSGAYYNEFDKFAADWLSELIKAGLIAPGEVDDRSIEDVLPSDLRGFTQCHFFAGIGVWSAALRRAGWDDSRAVWTMSCPCQPFSAAGKGDGFTDERHLWPAAFHLVTQCRPSIIIGEQVASKAINPWIDLVHADVEAMGYAFGCVPFPAAGVGATNLRDRAYWVANTSGARGCGWDTMEKRVDEKSRRPGSNVRPTLWPDSYGSGCNEPVGRVLQASYGNPGRVGRLRAYGNSINLEAARAFIETIDTPVNPPYPPCI